MAGMLKSVMTWLSKFRDFWCIALNAFYRNVSSADTGQYSPLNQFNIHVQRRANC